MRRGRGRPRKDGNNGGRKPGNKRPGGNLKAATAAEGPGKNLNNLSKYNTDK